MTLDVIVLEFAVVTSTIAPFKLALALLAPSHVVTLVLGAVLPYLDTHSMLLVVLPVALVHLPIEVLVGTAAVRFIVLPLTGVDVAVCVNEPPYSVGLPIGPMALVQGPVEPDLSTTPDADLQVCSPLALVNNAALHSIRLFRD